jgi:cell division protease FtsH
MVPKETAERTVSRGEGRSPEQRPPRPWRTEGLPEGRAPNRRPRWVEIVTFVLSYALLFGLLTVQDRMGGPQSIAYTEFKAQVANKNVGEVFARGNTIQGALRKTAQESHA